MTGSEALARLKELDTDIQTLNADIQELYNTVPSAAALYSSAAVSGCEPSDVTGNAAVKIARISETRDKLFIEWLNLYEQISMLLDQLDTRQSLILSLRYVLCYKWQQITGFMELGEKQCFRIHAKGLQEFCRLWEEFNRE